MWLWISKDPRWVNLIWLFGLCKYLMTHPSEIQKGVGICVLVAGMLHSSQKSSNRIWRKGKKDFFDPLSFEPSQPQEVGAVNVS